MSNDNPASLEASKKLDELRDRANLLYSQTPTAPGWMRLCDFIEAALQDSVVISSPPAVEFGELMLRFASDAIFFQSGGKGIAAADYSL